MPKRRAAVKHAGGASAANKRIQMLAGVLGKPGLYCYPEAAMETVGDIVKSKGNEVWSVSPITSVGEAVAIMAKKNIGAVLVIGTDGEPVGILSERDVARGLAKHPSDLKDRPVEDLMSTEVRCIKSDHSVDDAMAVMTHSRIRHLPVQENGKLAGMISIGDVVKAEIHEKDFVIEQLEHYITGSL